MAIEPEFSAFAGAYEAGRPQAVFTRRVADLDTPVSAYLKLAEGRDEAFLLESVQGGETRGRYSVIGIKPDLVWRCRDGKAEINRIGAGASEGYAAIEPAGRPLESLRQLFRNTQMALPETLPPMSVGLFGYLGYDMVRAIERLGPPPPDPLDLPDAILIRPTITAVFDNLRDEITIVSPVWPEKGIDARTAYARACTRVMETVADLDRAAPAVSSVPAPAVARDTEIRSNTTHEEYLRMVARAKEYVFAGDIFQIVPSQRFRRRFALPSISLYRALRRLNPSPFLYHLKFPGFAIVGSSPEILVRLRDGIVTIRPIAGTRRRGATPMEDKALAEELAGDPKERAEHLMLLDLGRNDVGRVTQTGSVRVTDRFFIERYSQLM